MLKMFELIDWTIVGKRLRELILSIDIVGIISAWISANVDNVGSIISGLFNIPEGAGNAISAILVPLTALSAVIIKIASSTGMFAFIQNMTVAFAKVKPHIDGISGALTGFNSKLIALPPTTTTVGTTIAGMFAQFQAGVPKMTILKEGIMALWTILKAHPVALVVTAIVALIATFIRAYQQSEKFRKEIDNLWENHIKPLWDNLTAFVGAILELLGGLASMIMGEFLTSWTDSFLTIWQVIQPILTAIIDAISAVLGALTGLITFITGVFTGDWQKAWEGIKTIFKNVFDGLVACAKAPINGIIGLINGMMSAVTSGVNTVIRALNRIKVNIPSWVPVYGGKSFGISIQQVTAPKIPLLANGGVITEPTVAMMGEYAGAYNNPEIVAPQSLLQSTIESSNKGIVDALIQQTRQLLVALEDINMEVSIGDETIAQSAKRGNQSYYKRTGKPLFV